MPDELAELMDTAIYAEIASHALYKAGQSRTQDPGAEALLEELAEEELRHSELLKEFKEKGLKGIDSHTEEVPNLMISEYLSGGDTLEGAGLQETLAFAMKHEQKSIEFYSKMMEIVRDESAKLLCQRLVREELRHKLKLETFYDDLFYGED